MQEIVGGMKFDKITNKKTEAMSTTHSEKNSKLQVYHLCYFFHTKRQNKQKVSFCKFGAGDLNHGHHGLTGAVGFAHGERHLCFEAKLTRRPEVTGYQPQPLFDRLN